MARHKKKQNEEPELFDAGIKTAPCVPEITRAVDQWREQNYEGITKTTGQLKTSNVPFSGVSGGVCPLFCVLVN